MQGWEPIRSRMTPGKGGNRGAADGARKEVGNSWETLLHPVQVVGVPAAFLRNQGDWTPSCEPEGDFRPRVQGMVSR